MTKIRFKLKEFWPRRKYNKVTTNERFLFIKNEVIRLS